MSIVTLNNRALRSATAVGTTTGLGAMTLIKKLTASSSSTLSFVDGASSVVFDNTYKEYLFTFNNMHSATNNTPFQFQVNADGQTGFNETITSTHFSAYNGESVVSTGLGYRTDNDLANGTGYQFLINAGNGNDESQSGYLHLFNPSSTTFVKHFIARFSTTESAYNSDNFTAGYINTTSAIDEISFKYSSGNMDSGQILLFGLN